MIGTDRLTTQHLEEILEVLPDGVTIQDVSGGLVYVNSAASKLMGLPSPDAALAMNPTDILDQFEIFDDTGLPIPITKLPGRLAILGEAEPEQVIGFKHHGKSQIYWTKVKASPIYNDLGEVVLAVNALQDITNLKNTQLQLIEANDRITNLLDGALG